MASPSIRYFRKRWPLRPVWFLTTSPAGFEYKDRFHNWSEVERIRRYDNLFWALVSARAGAPCAYVYLADGTKLIIRSRGLMVEGEPESVNRKTGITTAYIALLTQFITNSNAPVR